MASKLVLELIADTDKLLKGLDDAKRSVDTFIKGTESIGFSAVKAISAMGASLSLAGANATRLAVDFESSFAGVKKTVDATDAEFKQLEASLRGLAQEIPVNVNELNRIAESAGALGIAKEGLRDFTKVISQMATTTNLTADAAANDFARISTIMGVSASDFSRLGSTIVDLGNKGSTTESEITAMALRIVGAAKTVGMSAAEVAGLAASLSNVGIEAEMGGTAVSKIMIDMASNVASGGDKLAAFGKVAGMSAEQFATAFKTNAASAIGEFIAGLGRIQTSGGNLFATLEELDVKEVRLRDTMLRTASAGDMVSNTLQTARAAWQENSALSTEAGKRYETTASQIQLFQNKLTDTQLTLGSAFLPMLTKALQMAEPFVRTLGEWTAQFAALDQTSQAIIAGLVGFSTVLAPAIMGLSGFIRAVQTLIPLVQSLWALMLAHPFVAIATAVAVMAVAVIANWDKVHAALKNFGTSFNALIDGAITPATGAIRAATLYVVDLFNKMVDGIKAAVTTRLTSILNSVKQPIEQVKGYFLGLYDAVVGHSYIPDMVEEIGDHMRNLDVTMTAPARTAVINTGHVIETGVMTWGIAINQFAGTANQTWGSMSQTFAQSLVSMTDGAVQWGEVVKQMGMQLMTNMVTLFMGIATQWALSLFMQQTASTTANAAQVTAHTAMEAAKTAATVAGETARLGIVTATNKVIMAGVISTLGGIAAVGNAALATMQVVVTTTAGVLAAIGAGLAASIVGAPMAPAYAAAATAVKIGGTAAVAAGVGVLQGALGTAITTATGALLTPFAHGGIVTGPTMGLMGEAGSSEAAIPLNDRGAKFMQSVMGLGGNGTQQINLYVDGRLLTKQVVKNMPGVIHTKLGFT